MSSPRLTDLPVSELHAYERNARIHSEKQIRKLANSIQSFGFVNPVLIDQNRRIIAGHGRVEAAKLLGWHQVPCLQIEHLSEEEIRAYIIADNRLAELAGWDNEILRLELGELMSLDLDFDISVSGFEMPEIDKLLSDEEPEPPEPDLPAVKGDPVTRPGDLWRLGEHLVYCGDARLLTPFDRLLEDEYVDIVFTDPPYNVPIPGNVSGGKKHTNFAMACGEMSSEEFIAWLTEILKLTLRFCRTNSLHYICIDWRHMYELLTAGRSIYDYLVNICVWNKDNGGMGSMYRSKHELISVFKLGHGAHVNNVQLGRFGRYRTNVWDCPGMSSLQKGRDAVLAMHPTVKPVSLVADALLDASNRGDYVLDPFGGSGSTLLAAERTGRCARLLEIDPRYVDVTIQRYEEMTDDQAVLETSGKTFAEVAHERAEPEIQEVSSHGR